MNRSMPQRRSVRFGMAAMLIIALAAALAVISTTRTRPPESFWERFRITGLETSDFATLKEMLIASDAVVVARVSGVSLGRTIQGDSTDDAVIYAQIELEVEQLIAGSSPRSIPIEFLVGPTPEQAAADIKSLRESLPSELAVVFLHEKRGKGESGLYRVVNSAGLWTTTARSDLDTPLRDDAPDVSRLFVAELKAVGTLDGLIDLVAAYANEK